MHDPPSWMHLTVVRALAAEREAFARTIEWNYAPREAIRFRRLQKAIRRAAALANMTQYRPRGIGGMLPPASE